MKLIFSILCLGIVVGCSSFEQKLRRNFVLQEVFVRQTIAEENLGFRKISRMKPLVYKDTVIQANGLDGIGAYGALSGSPKWKLAIVNGAEASAAIINDRLFIGASDGQVYAINAETGEVLWTFVTKVETLSEPLIHDGVLYVLNGNNTLYALDAASGKQMWLYARQDTAPISVRGGSKPAFRNGTIYVGFSDGYVVALLAQNGALKWEKLISKNKKFKDIDTNPALEGDFLYISGYDDQVFCLRAATGETVWQAPYGGYGSLLIASDRLYVAATLGEMVALNKETGQKIWSYPVKKGIPTGASILKGALLFGESQGDLVVLDATSGKKLSSFTPGRGIFSTPTVDERTSMVYFISNEANLYGIRIGWSNKATIPYLR